MMQRQDCRDARTLAWQAPQAGGIRATVACWPHAPRHAGHHAGHHAAGPLWDYYYAGHQRPALRLGFVAAAQPARSALRVLYTDRLPCFAHTEQSVQLVLCMHTFKAGRTQDRAPKSNVVQRPGLKESKTCLHQRLRIYTCPTGGASAQRGKVLPGRSDGISCDGRIPGLSQPGFAPLGRLRGAGAVSRCSSRRAAWTEVAGSWAHSSTACLHASTPSSASLLLWQQALPPAADQRVHNCCTPTTATH